MIEFGVEVDPESVNMSREGVRRIADVFAGQFLSGQHPGAQLVVMRHGKVVLDRTIGVTRIGSMQSVRPDTPFVVFSCTKPVVAIALHMLIEQGKVELDAPIAEYWPEFGIKGKEKATVRHAFLHQAGIPVAGLYWEIPRYWNWEQAIAIVANLELEFEPGTRTAYHIVNYGYLIGEVIRRASGRSVERFVQEEIYDPLEMKNSFLALPYEERERSSELYYGHPDQRNAVLLMRQARYTVVPAGTMNSTARDMAIFYQMLLDGGYGNEHRLLKPETVRYVTQAHNADYDHTLQAYTRWGLGFGIGGPKPPRYRDGTPIPTGRQSTIHTFGHAGQRSSNTWADWEKDVLVIFICNQLNGQLEASLRWQSISDAVWDAILD